MKKLIPESCMPTSPYRTASPWCPPVTIWVLVAILLAVMIFLGCAAHTDLNKTEPNAARLFSQAKQLKQEGNYSKAALHFQQALNLERQRPDPDPDFLVLSLANLNLCYFVLGEYEQAIQAARQALTISRGRNDQQSTAQGYRSMAIAYRAWGKYQLALKHFGRALELDIQLDAPEDIARDLAGIGSIYYHWDEYDEALKFIQQALIINQKFGFEANLAENFNASGMIYEARGQCETALPQFKRALALDQKLNRTGSLAAVYSNIGICYRALGQYQQALAHFQKALALNKKIGKRLAIARDLSHIGLLFSDWGSYDKALSHFQQALDIGRKVGKSEFVANNLNNIGTVYMSVLDYENAIVYLKQALQLHRNLGLPGDVAREAGNLGIAHLNLEQWEQALDYFNEALEIDQKLGREDAIARDLNNIGMVLSRWELHEEALKFFTDALEIDRKLGKKAEAALKHNNVGMSHYYLNRYDQAIQHFKAAIELKEQLRQTARGDLRRDYLASQIHTYEWLVDAYLKNGDFANMFAAMELSRAKLLAEQLAKSDGHMPVPTASEIQAGLDSETAVLIFAGIHEPPFFQLVMTQNTLSGLQLDINTLVNPPLEAKYGPLPGAPNAIQRGIRIAARNDMQPTAPNQKKNPFDGIVHLYRQFLLNPTSGGARGIRVAPTAGDTQPDLVRELGMRLYRLLVKPAAPYLKDKKRLIIVPDGILAYLPFETLIDDQGQYLAETYTIGYVQSLAVMNLINRRHYSADRKPLLAMGGATYESVANAAEPVQTDNDLRRLAKQVDAAIETQRSVRHVYAALQMASWQDLPGTLAEVSDIANIVPDTDFFTGTQVSEHHIKALSAQGRLKAYKVIHLATHGLVMPSIPALSALVLSQFSQEHADEDGYLRMGEIAELQLAADFVNLSACETGLGRIYGGEGVVGLPQAFLIAGANGLSVSLWQVADESTARFMTSLYQHVQQTGIGYDEALAHIKRRFIRGEFSELYRAPYFWAPFVYYGK